MLKSQKILASIFLAAITFLGSLPSAVSANDCPDINIIFARGSGAAATTSEDYQAFRAALLGEFKSRNASVSTNFYDLGTSPHGGHQYPAASIENPTTLLGATIGSGQAFTFGESVREGIAELKSYVAETSRSCANTRYILAGYSQGAMVISYTLKDLPSEKIIYAATFGDPKLYLPEGKKSSLSGKPLACAGKNLSNYRIDVPDCEVESGILGALNPYQLTPYVDKLGAWCNEGDFMCGSYFDFSELGNSGTYEGRNNPLAGILKAHLSYKTDNSYANAAKIIADATAKAYPGKITTTNSTSHHQDLAILIDITGSMSPLIEQYREEALNLAKKVKAAGGIVALYTYGDELTEYVAPTLLCDAACSLGQIRTKLDEISVNGGGDEPESALSALLHVMNTMTWHKGANKSIVLLTDASYHSTDVGGITLNDVVKRSYEIDPVNIFTITPEDIAKNYTSLTTQTGGQTFDSATEIPLSTETILDRPYVNIGEPHFSDAFPATISDHSITYEGSSATITLSANSTTALYLTLDDAPLGLTLNQTFTLTDLPEKSTLTVIPINPDGHPGTPLSLLLTPPTPTPPRNMLVFTPKTPNCGIK